MLSELESNFTALEKQIIKLSREHRRLAESYEDLLTEHTELKHKYEDTYRQNQELLEEQKKIKIMSSIAGNPEHNRLMKNHINRLVKGIDACIAQLHNSGL